MSIEFVCVLAKNPYSPMDNNPEACVFHGSLIDKPIFKKRYIGDVGDFGFWLYTLTDPQEEIRESFPETPIFDGEAVFEGVHSKNHLPDDYYNFTRNARGSFCVLEFEILLDYSCLKVTNDPLGLYPILYIEEKDFFVITNNPILSESFARQFHGIYFNRHKAHVLNEVIAWSPLDVGPFEGMKYLPFDKEVMVSKYGFEIRSKKGEDYYFKPVESLDEILEDAASEVCENVKAIAESTEHTYKVCDISGGIDSRMVLAAILSTGSEGDFYYNTGGSYPSPDANIGNYIIEKYNLKKCKIIDPEMRYKTGSLESDPERCIKTFCYASSGMKNNVDRHVSSRSKDATIFKIGGGFSSYKANYSNKLKASDGVEDAVNLIVVDDVSVPEADVSPVRDYVRYVLVRWMVHDSMTLRSAVDRFHIEYRGRFHIGVCEHWGRYHGGKSHPLNSPSLVRASFSIDDDDRANDVLTFKLMHKLFSPLVFVPLERRVWNPNSYSHLGTEVAGLLEKVKPVTINSDKLFSRDPSVKKIKISRQKGHGSEAAIKNVKRTEWELKQIKLKRKHFWRELEKIKHVYLELYEEFSKEGFCDAHVECLAKKELDDYKTMREVIELHCMTTWLVFFLRSEVAVKV